MAKPVQRLRKTSTTSRTRATSKSRSADRTSKRSTAQEEPVEEEMTDRSSTGTSPTKESENEASDQPGTPRSSTRATATTATRRRQSTRTATSKSTTKAVDSTDASSDGEFLKGLIFAPPDHGKTRFLGTAALDERTSPAIFLNFEGGFLTLQGLPGEGDLWETRRIRSWDDYNAIAEELPGRFKFCGVDSISETHIYALLNILEEEEARRRDGDMLQIQDYGKAMIQLRRFVRWFRDLPMHVVFTASAKDHQDPKRGMIKKPGLSGQLSDDIPGMMDVVGYLAIINDPEEGEYRSLLLGGEPKIATKCRMPWGVDRVDEIPDPDLTKLLDTLGF